jgi:5-methylcytosine-specific restriction endonuclease McrA
MLRVCIKCNKELPIERFYTSGINKTGYRGACKECTKIASDLQYARNRGKILAGQKQYRIDNFDKVEAYRIQYNIINKDMVSKKHSRYYELNKEQINEHNKQYYESHPEGHRIRYQRYRASRRKLQYTLTIPQWEEIKLHFNNSCAYCGMDKEPLVQEHFLAMSKGGEYSSNNIIPACKHCNSSKREKNFFEWYPKYEHYSKKREKTILEFLNYKNGIQQLTSAL